MRQSIHNHNGPYENGSEISTDSELDLFSRINRASQSCEDNTLRQILKTQITKRFKRIDTNVPEQSEEFFTQLEKPMTAALPSRNI